MGSGDSPDLASGSAHRFAAPVASTAGHRTLCYSPGSMAGAVENPFEGLRLGETPEVLPVSRSEDAQAAALALTRQARRTIEIMSRHLDPRLYDTAELAEAIKQLALGSHRAQVRILVQDVDPLLRDGHRLLALAQRLPTFIQIRVPAPPFREFNQAFLVADETGYLHRHFADRFEGDVCFHGPAAARELLRLFEPMWESAEPDPSLRALRI